MGANSVGSKPPAAVRYILSFCLLRWITLLRSITCLFRWITFFEVYNLPEEVGNLLVEVDDFRHNVVGVVVLADTAVIEVVFAEGSPLTVAGDNQVVRLV